LDGYSRAIVHGDLRESMTEAEIEVILQRAREKYPEAKPRIISGEFCAISPEISRIASQTSWNFGLISISFASRYTCCRTAFVIAIKE